MTDTSAASVPEISFAIDYSIFTAPETNPSFTGSGELTIRADGPTYVFSGKPRGLSTGKTSELVFGPADITNVVVTDRKVKFKAAPAQTRKEKRPFVFYCRDAVEARTVADFLPKTVDPEFTETQDFTVRLKEIAGASGPWTSVTNIIIALNVGVFVVMGFLGAGWIQTESMTPYILYGANNGAATTDGQWWRLLTSMFTHYGLMHLLLNMWALFQAGHFVEKLLGRTSYALMYLASGLAGGFASICWHGDKIWSAGASGAIFGVYGALLGYMLREKQALPKGVYQSLMKSTLTFAGYNIVYGLARAGIDNAAHVGGIAGGLVFGGLLALPLNREVRQREGRRRLAWGLAALAVLVTLGVALTPRFDYRVSEVLAWEDANRDYIARETELLKQWQSQNDSDSRTLEISDADRIESQLIPFYDDWRQKLNGLHLSPDKSTAGTRAAFLHILDLKVASYRQFALGIRAHDPRAEEQFQLEQARILREVEKLQETGKQR
jgi:rhomboid protease GluP